MADPRYYYSLKFTENKVRKQIGASSPLAKEEFEDMVKAALDRKTKDDTYRKTLKPDQRKEFLGADFFGFKGVIADIQVVEEQEEKKPPADSPVRQLDPAKVGP